MAQSEHHEDTEQLKVPDVLPACALVPPSTRPPAAPEARGRPAGRAPEQAADGAAAAAAVATEGARRCEGCRRKVGLMGFRCRCGGVFCGEHRYSDRHGCAFDYRAAGRDAIARANPVVRAEKILRI